MTRSPRWTRGVIFPKRPFLITRLSHWTVTPGLIARLRYCTFPLALIARLRYWALPGLRLLLPLLFLVFHRSLYLSMFAYSLL